MRGHHGSCGVGRGGQCRLLPPCTAGEGGAIWNFTQFFADPEEGVIFFERMEQRGFLLDSGKEAA
jgi:hypothetical protein